MRRAVTTVTLVTGAIDVAMFVVVLAVAVLDAS